MAGLKKVFLRTPYNYDVGAASDKSGLLCTDDSRTKQQFAEEVDINTIVKRFGVTGVLPAGRKPPTFGDFTGIGTFHEAMNMLAHAETEFMKLPSTVRAKFQNDPGQLLDFLQDDRNYEEAFKLGLVNERPKPPPKTPDAKPEAAKDESGASK